HPQVRANASSRYFITFPLRNEHFRVLWELPKAKICGLKIKKGSKQHLCSPQSVVLLIHSDLKQEQIK
ncbi:MAG: hypothetical protein VW729_18945, partial [Deltaproteobacteria bacterium]